MSQDSEQRTQLEKARRFWERAFAAAKATRNPICVCGHTLSQHERVPNIIKESSPIYCGFCKCADFRTCSRKLKAGPVETKEPK